MFLTFPPASSGTFILDPFTDRTITQLYFGSSSGTPQPCQVSIGGDTLIQDLPAPLIVTGTAPAVGDDLINTNLPGAGFINGTISLKTLVKKGQAISYLTGTDVLVMFYFS